MERKGKQEEKGNLVGAAAARGVLAQTQRKGNVLTLSHGAFVRAVIYWLEKKTAIV